MAVLVLVLAGAGAWVVATRVESPTQLAARAEAPAPAPVVAALDRGYLQGQASLSTTAQHERVVALKPPAAMGGVVTFVASPPGATLTPGSVLMRVNGRPVFVLPGSFPLYRDLQPGASGDDVVAVQTGLRAAGYATGADRAGTYGAGTQAALRRMYKAGGYSVPEVSPPTAASATPAAGAASNPASEQSATATPSPPASSAVSGPQVLRSEVLMIADLPATVQGVAAVGTELASDSDLVTLGAGQIVLSATLPNASVGALAVGAVATFSDDAGAPGTATVTAISPGPAADQTVVSLSAEGAVSSGAAYVVTIDNPAAETAESLLAPVAAVVARGGRSYIYPRDGESFKEVEVHVTGSVGGIAAIEAVDTTTPLDKGTEVRIGAAGHR